MRVCIVAPSPVPYTPGGAERLFAGLVEAMGDRDGVEAEVVKLPSPERDFREIVDSYRAFSLLDLGHFDLVVSTKYPAWMVDHPNHIVYMLHPLRGVYDSYHHFQLPLEPVEPLAKCVCELRGLLTTTPRRSSIAAVLDQADACVAELGVDDPALLLPSPLLRLLVRWLDRVALGRSSMKRHLTISETVANRSGYFPPGTYPRAVVPPSSMPISLPGRGADDPFVFTASRLDGPKRIDMLIDAMSYVGTDIEFRIAGSGPAEELLRERASGDSRIHFVGRLSEEELSQAYADARAVLFTPLDEDLGLVTLEAQMSGTPVITVTDSGGPNELVDDGVTGLVTSPDAESLGRAIEQLSADRTAARQMGAAGRRSAATVTWAKVVDALLGEDQLDTVDVTGRRRVVVLSTYPIEPARGGGQLRCRFLYEPLGEKRDVVFLCLAPAGEPASRRLVAPGVVQIAVPPSEQHLAAEATVEAEAGIPVTDIAASMFIDLTPDYIDELRYAVEGADLAILAHPYLLPALRMVAPDLPFIYDSHNAETVMKRDLLPSTTTGLDLVDVVSAVEEAAVANGTVTMCSPNELGAYERWSSSELLLIPNGADIAGTPFTDPGLRRTNRDRWLRSWVSVGGHPYEHLAIFVGSWHPPNLDAVEWILEGAPRRPDTLFLIAGSQCGYFNERDLPDNVVMRGRVSDQELGLLLASADIALNPMRHGAGTNLKILEYFAAGVPVVATAVGARGIGADPDVHYFEVDPDSDMTLSIEAATDPFLIEPAVLAARTLVEAGYDWRVLAEQFATVVENAIAN